MSSREYLPELERARAARDKSLQDMKDESMVRLTRDLAVDKQQNPALNEAWEEGDDGVDEDAEDNIIDRCESPSRIWRSAAPVYGTLVQPKVLGGESTSISPDKGGTGTSQIGLDQPDRLADRTTFAGSLQSEHGAESCTNRD